MNGSDVDRTQSGLCSITFFEGVGYCSIARRCIHYKALVSPYQIHHYYSSSSTPILRDHY